MFCAQMCPIYQVSVYRTIGPPVNYRTTIAMFNIFVHELITAQQMLKNFTAHIFYDKIFLTPDMGGSRGGGIGGSAPLDFPRYGF